MLMELGFTQGQPACIGENNKACISMAYNDITSARNKHIDVRFHFVRDAIRKKVVTLYHVNTKEMLADMFTEPLRNPEFKKLTAIVMQFSEEGC
jgi:hypothetical protein